MRVINKEKFIKDVVERATERRYTDGQLYTVRKIAETTKEVRYNPEKNEALTLQGINVYTVTYDVFMELVQESFYEIDEKEFNADTMIKELDAKDKRIDKK